MSNNCMSFSDLFHAANGRDFSEQERTRFSELSQPERNAAVKHLAHRATGIRTEDRVGTDGIVYTAFWRDERLTGHQDFGDGFSTVKQTSDPRYPGGLFRSFGSDDADGRHKTTVVEDSAGNIVNVAHHGGGFLNGSFVKWAKKAFTG